MIGFSTFCAVIIFGCVTGLQRRWQAVTFFVALAVAMLIGAMEMVLYEVG